VAGYVFYAGTLSLLDDYAGYAGYAILCILSGYAICIGFAGWLCRLVMLVTMHAL
jgi:hypothetical protein